MISIQENVLLAPFTTFGIGGLADYFYVAKSLPDLITAITLAREKNMPFFILGSGANILVGDKGFRGLVIKNEARKLSIDDTNITVESGAIVAEVISETAKVGLSGFEHFAGIPSTIGGALWQNLHFLSADRKTTVYIGDILEQATILTQDGEEKQVPKEYFHFGYDESILHTSKDVVLKATFLLHKDDSEKIQKIMRDNLSWREEKHPYEAWKKSAGSVFKKIEGYGAGRLIEKVGLKGYTLGGAMVSDKHANFIINTGKATALDVKNLINIIQKKVKEQLGLELTPEISFIGEF